MHFRSRLRLFLALPIVALVIGMAWTWSANANPPGVPGNLRKVYSFNMIGYPEGQEYTGGCGQGNRIFVNRDAHHAHILVTDTDSGWDVTDCNATADNQGELTTDEAGTYLLYARILGKMDGNVRVCADTYEDHLSGEHLCLLGVLDMTRGKREKFNLVPTSMYDAELEDIMWSVDTNSDFRIVQFRVYKAE